MHWRQKHQMIIFASGCNHPELCLLYNWRFFFSNINCTCWHFKYLPNENTPKNKHSAEKLGCYLRKPSLRVYKIDKRLNCDDVHNKNFMGINLMLRIWCILYWKGLGSQPKYEQQVVLLFVLYDNKTKPSVIEAMNKNQYELILQVELLII